MIDFSPSVCVFGSEHIALALVALVGTTRHGWLRERERVSVHGGSINMQEGRRSEQSLAAHSLLHPFTADYFSPVYP